MTMQNQAAIPATEVSTVKSRWAYPCLFHVHRSSERSLAVKPRLRNNAFQVRLRSQPLRCHRRTQSPSQSKAQHMPPHSTSGTGTHQSGEEGIPRNGISSAVPTVFRMYPGTHRNVCVPRCDSGFAAAFGLLVGELHWTSERNQNRGSHDAVRSQAAHCAWNTGSEGDTRGQ